MEIILLRTGIKHVRRMRSRFSEGASLGPICNSTNVSWNTVQDAPSWAADEDQAGHTPAKIAGDSSGLHLRTHTAKMIDKNVIGQQGGKKSLQIKHMSYGASIGLACSDKTACQEMTTKAVQYAPSRAADEDWREVDWRCEKGT